ncbi:MAG: HEAT repeat domain-containing protein [Planctomycetaceae bacterium]|nr:HEAT repeat domain-containing protein [Planctomycetaceae bacterium]
MKKYSLPLLFTLLFLNSLYSAEEAWNTIRTYQFGDELVPLNAVEQEIHRSAVSPETRAEMAAKLASFLNEETTYAGRQFVCLQLRFIGTAAEVPVLAKYLNHPEDTDNARMALQSIAGEEALIPLRKALETFQGRNLTGVIESLAERRDAVSVPALVKLCDSEDRQVAAAALAALGAFDDTESLEALMKPRESVLEMTRLNSLLRVGYSFLSKGDTTGAKKIFDVLCGSENPMIIRRAAWEGTLRTLPEPAQNALVHQWFFEEDSVKNVVAASHLKQLSPAQFDELFNRVAEMNPRVKAVFLELATRQHSEKLVENLRKTLETGSETERLAAIRTLGLLGDPEVVPLLVEMLKDKSVQDEVAETLKRFSKEIVGPLLIRELDRAEIRLKVLDIMSDLKCYDAIDPLVVMAQSEDANVFVPVIAALGRIGDPDDSDIPRFLKLYLASRPGLHRENVERAIVVVCERIPDPALRADILLKHLRSKDGELAVPTLITTLPLLGKLGNQQVADLLFPLLTSDQNDQQQAAIRALCNWPNADFKDELWNIATKNPSQQYSQWALRAYIRVVTLKNDRPESETLTMLQDAMKFANNDADRRLCLNRTSTVRTMEAVQWVAGYLDDPALAQTACETLAELGRHRFLREPNKEQFHPILLKVENTSKDNRVIESVKRSRLGM